MLNPIPDGFDWLHGDYTEVFELRMDFLKRIRAPGFDLAALKAHFAEHPVDFINTFGMTTDPRNADIGKPVQVPFLLFPKQEEFVEWAVGQWRGRKDGVVEKSRDMGVSWLCVAVAVWAWLYHPEIVIGFGSRKEEYVDKIGDPKSIFWKVRSFINALPSEFRPAGWNEAKDAPFMRVLNRENGAAIVGEAGDNIGRGNRAAIYFIDESAFLEHAEAIDAALSQTANCKLHVSTPNGAGNPFYRKRHGGKMDVFIFDWHDDPRKNQAWYDKQCRDLEPHVVAQEIDRNYEASVINAFIAGDLVAACMVRGVASVSPVGKLRVGVDPARFGDDKFAVTIRRGRAVVLQVETQNLDSIAGATWVKGLIDPYGERPEQIAVDVIGIGAGVADQLRAWYGKIVVDVNSSIRLDGEHGKNTLLQVGSSTVCYNMRAFMYLAMREWLAAQASIPNDAGLKSELTSIRFGYRGGAILLESKDDMRKRGVKSPNKADSLALTFADPSSPEELTRHQVFHNPSLQLGNAPASRAGY